MSVAIWAQAICPFAVYLKSQTITPCCHGLISFVMAELENCQAHFDGGW